MTTNEHFTQLIGLVFVTVGVLCVPASIQIYRRRKSLFKTGLASVGFLTAMLFFFYGFFLLLVG